MAIVRSHRPVAAARIAAIARQLLDASELCAIATVAPHGRAHVNTAYFAWSPHFEVVWLSEPSAMHSRHVRFNGTVAIAVYDSRQTWGKPDRGVQLFGSAAEAAAADVARAEKLYAKRFPGFVDADFSAYRFYLFTSRRLKLFDEHAMAAGTFVTARVTREGRLAWERTEIYRSHA